MFNKGDIVRFVEKPDKSGSIWFPEYKGAICIIMDDEVELEINGRTWRQCDVKFPDGEIYPIDIRDLKLIERGI